VGNGSMTLPVGEALRERTVPPSDDAGGGRQRGEKLRKGGPSAPHVAISCDTNDIVLAPRHWESLYGTLCSLGVHVALLTVLGFLVLESADHNVGSIVGVLGQPETDVPAEFILDSALVDNKGGSTEPLEIESRSVLLSDSGATAANVPVPGMGLGDGAGDDEGNNVGVSVPAINVPGHAVTKGSFSAWTVPEDPLPGENYVIMIQVRLPPQLQKGKAYPAKDISGMVVGTDGYRKVIRFHPNEKVEIQEGVVQFQLPIPGAKQLVRDTIRIESKLLKEKQVIQLVF
jgi:hypothetical protein